MDVYDITQKKYTMATTRPGKVLDYRSTVKKEKDEHKLRSYWDKGDEVKKMCVEYHMTQTLIDIGIELVRPMWPEQNKGRINLDTKEE